MNEKKKKSNYFENYDLEKSSNIYRYSGSKYKETKSFPSVESIYHDAIIYRKEDYGVFVNFDKNNYSGLLHKSKLYGKSLDNFSINDIISVKVIEIKNTRKISVRLFEEDFPSLNGCNVNSNTRWNKNLTKVMEPVPNERIRKKKNISGTVKCKYSGKLISEASACKCKESMTGELYYFEDLNLVLKYNKENNRYLKLLLSNGRLERVSYLMINNDEKIDDIEIL